MFDIIPRDGLQAHNMIDTMLYWIVIIIQIVLHASVIEALIGNISP